MSRINYKKLVKPNTFLDLYLQYNSKSETPYAYDFWSGLWVLSSALGRGVYVDRSFAPVYLNLYVVLVAESGVTRKSTSVRRAVNMLRSRVDDAHPLVEAKITPEMLEFQLARQTKDYGHAYVAIAIDELVKFLGREKYVDTMPTLLTDLYDCPALRTGGGSLMRGSTRFENVYVSFLSASTPSWLLRAVNPDVIEGGFTSRVLFVVSEKPKLSNPWPVAPDEELFQRISDSLERIEGDANKFPRISISKGARSVFDAWYKRREFRRDAYRSTFQSREDDHILRLAALLSINDGVWEIQIDHIRNAIKVIEEVKDDGASIFEGTGTGSKTILGFDALRDKLLAGGLGGVRQSDLTKHCAKYINAEVVRTGLAIMHELGMVQRFADIKVARGRPTTIWRATSALASSRALDQIVERTEP